MPKGVEQNQTLCPDGRACRITTETEPYHWHCVSESPPHAYTLPPHLTCPACGAYALSQNATILFCDIDGVLNSSTYFTVANTAKGLVGGSGTPPRGRILWDGTLLESLDPAAVTRFNRLVEHSKTAIVVSSSWKHMLPHDELYKVLRAQGVEGAFLGCTPDLFGRPRGEEIAAWLDARPDVQRWAILDDRSDMGDLAFALIQTTWTHGLLDEHVEQALALLASG